MIRIETVKLTKPLVVSLPEGQVEYAIGDIVKPSDSAPLDVLLAHGEALDKFDIDKRIAEIEHLTKAMAAELSQLKAENTKLASAQKAHDEASARKDVPRVGTPSGPTAPVTPPT